MMAGDPPVPILIVNDRAADLVALAAALASLDQTLLTTTSPQEALRIAAEQPIAVAILDISMPEMDGFELAGRLRAAEGTRSLPIIFVSAMDPTPETLDRVYALGAVDYLPSPVSARPLQAKVRVFVELHRQNIRLARLANEIRDEAGASLTAQQERFQLLMDAASDYALFFTNAEGVVMEWPTSAEHLFGFAESEAVGQSAALIFTAEDRAAGVPLLEIQTAILRGQAPDERWHIRKDHTRFFAVGRLVALRRPDGTIHGFAKIVRDATQQRAAEEHLRESEEQFRAVFELAAVGHVIIDPATGRFERVNPEFSRITGYSPAELLPLTFVEITHPEDRADATAQFERLKRGEVSQLNTEQRYLRHDGDIVWAQVSATLLRRPDGTPWMHLSVIQDITARKRAEHELMESRRQLRLAIDAAELGTFFHDLSRQTLVHSERANRLLGLPADAQVTAETWLARVHPDDATRVRQTLAARRGVGENADDLHLEYRVVWPDGSVHHIATASRAVVARAADGNKAVYIVGTLRDVTATKEFEQELQTKVAERTAALEEKTAQLEGFCYTVAHDLRSPLRAISGYADIVIEDFGTSLPAGGGEYMHKIKASAGRLDQLINDLLAYSRITQVDVPLADVPLQSSVDWALQQLQHEVRAKHALVEVNGPLPRVRGERSVLDQVMLNLLSNALKFVPPGRTPQVRVMAEPRGGMVRLMVRDNGIGISDTYHQRIFRVFERLQQARDFPGTGVGLAIVAKAAERLGGRVGVESTPGTGSTFWLDLQPATA